MRATKRFLLVISRPISSSAMSSSKSCTPPCASSIRPTVRYFPMSADMMEDSKLPFAVTLAPLDDQPLPSKKADEVVRLLSSIPKCLNCGAPHACEHTFFQADTSPSMLVCYLCGRASESGSSQPHFLSDSGMQVFELPLRLGSHFPQYSVSAVQCPLLWIIILDGCCHERTYWKLVSESLQDIAKSAPPCVHVAIGIASTREVPQESELTPKATSMLGLFDLHSPMPHIYHSEVQFFDGTHASTDLLRHLQLIRHPHVASTIRSLVDYEPMSSETEGMTASLTMSITRQLMDQLKANGKLAGQRKLDAANRESDHRLAYAGAKLSFVGNVKSTSQRPLGERYSTIGLSDKDDVSTNYPLGSDVVELGKGCADVGLGIDLVNWSSRLGCVASLCPLADRSGAPAASYGDILDELTSRAPWKSVFGAELRLRVSPGFAAGTIPTGGPGYSLNEQLWRAGCFSPSTAVAMELSVHNGRSKDKLSSAFIPCREVPLEPAVQTCFAYTTIQYDSETDDYQIVRRMRIASRRVPFAPTMEVLLGSVDPEALAVVLFHKLAVERLETGPEAAAKLAVEWLGSFLRSVYKSAEEEYERSDPSSRYFVAADRLLDIENSTLLPADILLAAGHERLRPIVLMVYLLLQSDPLRACSGLSMDQVQAEVSQMISMPPNILTRAIAPRLQLWSPNKILREVLELRSEAIQSALLEHKDGTLLLLDTPKAIVVMDARFINSDRASPKGGKSGEQLKLAVEDSAQSYRVRPRVTFEENQTETAGEFTFLTLLDVLIEDTANIALGYDSFASFKKELANEIEA